MIDLLLLGYKSEYDVQIISASNRRALYRTVRPSDFSYKHEAKHNTCLVVTQLWGDEEDSDDTLLTDLSVLCCGVKACELSVSP